MPALPLWPSSLILPDGHLCLTTPRGRGWLLWRRRRRRLRNGGERGVMEFDIVPLDHLLLLYDVEAKSIFLRSRHQVSPHAAMTRKSANL